MTAEYLRIVAIEIVSSISTIFFKEFLIILKKILRMENTITIGLIGYYYK